MSILTISQFQRAPVEDHNSPNVGRPFLPIAPSCDSAHTPYALGWQAGEKKESRRPDIEKILTLHIYEKKEKDVLTFNNIWNFCLLNGSSTPQVKKSEQKGQRELS